MLRNRTIFGFLLFHLFLSSSAQSPHMECSPKADPEYEWENWNYYEMLGLSKENNNMQTKEVRKAYRKQAQQWHPDKNPSNTTSEECTARFTKIAQAYEILNDHEKRQEYNSFLHYCDQQQGSSSASKKNRWSSMFQNFADPLQVFEEFFFGSSEFQSQETTWQDAYSNFQTQSSFDSSSSKPIRVSNHQEFLQDPFSGEETIRVLQNEDFSPDASGRYYFRVYAQDFKKTFDPFTGITYVPISQPYLRDEGFRYTSDEKPQSNHRRSTPDSQTILFPGDILTPRSKLLASPNKRYYAGLSPDCELLVMADNGHRQDDDLIWSSQTLSQTIFSKKTCFATLRGPHIVVGMERPGMPHQILWFSEAATEDEDEEESTYYYNTPQQQHSTYLAQLDNDGSLVVYKVWNVPRRAHSLPERAWIAANNFLQGQARAEYDVLYSPFSITYRRCVYATGPLGCFRVARRLYELSLSIYYTIKNLVSQVDSKIDSFMDLVLEEDDFLRAFRGSLRNNGVSIGSKSVRLVRRVMRYVLMKANQL